MTQPVALGWDKPPIHAVADRLWEQAHRAGTTHDLGDTMVVLPTGRTGRRLGELLVNKASETDSLLIPPQIVTIAGAARHLLPDISPPAAPPLLSKWAWARALHAADPDDQQAITALPPTGGVEQWQRLAGRLAPAVSHVLSAMHAPADVAAALEDDERFTDAQRWRAIDHVFTLYQQQLAEMGFTDADLRLRQQLESWDGHTPWRVVLAGVVELNATQLGMVRRLGDRLSIWVATGADQLDRFTEWGTLIPERWADENTTLPLRDEQITLTEHPRDQALALARHLVDLPDGTTTQQVSVAVPDGEAVPWLVQRLTACGQAARDAAGTPVRETPVYRLLVAVMEFIEQRRLADFATLLRHPDMERAALRALHAADDASQAVEDWQTLLDQYHTDHLQPRLAGEWLGPKKQALAALHDAVLQLIGHETDAPDSPLTGDRPLHAWQEPVRALLRNVYAHRSYAQHDARDRLTIETCQHVQRLLEVITDRHTDLEQADPEPTISFAGFLRLITQELQGETIPPPADEHAVELLGWLELPWDDAEHAVLTGMNEGSVPEYVAADALLPEPIRRTLGLTDNTARHARDAYALDVILRGRAAMGGSVKLIVGRRTPAGDPLLPSRLLFACGDDALVKRAQHLYDEQNALALSGPEGLLPREQRVQGITVPDLPEGRVVTGLRVTAFRDFLACPYRAYLRHILKLESVDDQATELAPNTFGQLAHDVLTAFGRDQQLTTLTDADTLAKALTQRLQSEARQAFGRRPHPAVRIQLLQLERRLEHFAAHQARRAAEGWRVMTELTERRLGPEAAWLEVDGERFYLRGRIDRIDYHPDSERYAVLDYKTGDTGKTPDDTHRKGRGKDKTWIDLQLPLYRHLARAMGVNGEVELGYVLLPKEAQKAGFAPAYWSEQELRAADEAAARVVRMIRAGRFEKNNTAAGQFAELSAICQDTALSLGDDADAPDGGDA